MTPISTFTIGFDSAEFNETPYARIIAKQIGSNHKERFIKIDAISAGVKQTKITSWDATLIQKSYRNRGMAVVMAQERIAELEDKAVYLESPKCIHCGRVLKENHDGILVHAVGRLNWVNDDGHLPQTAEARIAELEAECDDLRSIATEKVMPSYQARIVELEAALTSVYEYGRFNELYLPEKLFTEVRQALRRTEIQTED